MITSFILKHLNKEASSSQSMPDEILARLHLQEGQTAADIGSGGGYFTLALSRRVGKTGRVYAVDVRKKNLDFIRRQAEQAGPSNIIFVLASKSGPELPDAGLDLVFARNVFHHLPSPETYFAGLKRSLKPGGRVAIIERMKKGFGFDALFGHHTSPEIIRGRMEKAGYILSESFGFLRKQTFSLFMKRT